MRRAVLLLVLSFSTATAWGQPDAPHFERFGVREGLSNEHVLSIAQDSLGFLWVGTRDGLSRYDGHGFRTYRLANGDLAGREVRELLVDREDRLWVVTGDGGAVFDRRTGQFQRIRLPGADGVLVTTLAQDADGGMWAGTHGGGLFYREPRGARTAGATPWRRMAVLGIPDQDARLEVAMLMPSTSGVWAEVAVAGEIHTGPVDRERGMTHRLPRSEGSLRGADQDGRLVLASMGDQIVTLQPGPDGRVSGTVEFRNARGTLPFGPFAKVGEGRWWLPSDDGVIEWERTSGRMRRIRASLGQRGGLGNDGVEVVFRDRRGGIWVGTTSGLYLSRVRALPFQTFRRVQGEPATLSDNRVNGLSVDGDGRLWVATNGGMNRLDLATGRNERLPYRTPADSGIPADDAFWSVLHTSGGATFLGPKRTDAHQLRGGRLEVLPAVREAWQRWTRDSGVRSGIRGMAEDARGRLWIASSRGLTRVDLDGRAVAFGAPGADRGLTDRRTNTVYPAQDGSLWIGTDNGLFRYDEATETVRFVAKPCGPSVWSITEALGDPGALWASTFGGGLARLDFATGRVSCIGMKEGLPSDLVYGVVSDERGALWAGTTSGLARVELAPGGAPGRVSVYNVEDGIQSDDHNFMAQLRLADGRLAFGGPAGLTVFDPADIARRSGGETTTFSGVEVLGRLREGVPLPGDTLRLRHDQNFFGIHFATLDFRAPSRHRYRYRLVGLDEAWREADAASPRAAYTGLPPGTYRFEVVGTTHWSDEGGAPAVLTLDVVPAWWQTWWARVAVGLLLLGLGVAAARRSTQRRVAAVEARRRDSEEVQRRHAESRERERRRLARDLHDGPVQGLYRVGHDLDALERVAGPRAADIRDTRARLGEISGELREMLGQLRPTLALHLPLPDALDALANRFERRHGTRVETAYGTSAEGADDASRLALFRIAQEALANVARHAGAQTVRVALTTTGTELRLRIADDGCGFEVPERLVALARTEHYGLVGMAERAEAVGGRFSVRQREGGGTVVEAVVPCETDAPPAYGGV